MSVPMDNIISERTEIDTGTLSDSGFFWRDAGTVKVLVCKALEDVGFANGFSTRIGGVSDFPRDSLNLAGFDEDTKENIYENRHRFLRAFEGNYLLATVWQVHGDAIKVVRDAAAARNHEEQFDAIASNLNGVLAGVKTADCVPVLIGDPVKRAFAAVHAGWRGTVKGITSKAVETLEREFGSSPSDLVVAIGPCAGRDRYEVGRDVIDAVEKEFSTSGKLLVETRKDHALIDLQSANREKLISCGVNEDRIHTAPLCTIEREDLFFSYRRDKQLMGKTGRLASVIGLRQASS